MAARGIADAQANQLSAWRISRCRRAPQRLGFSEEAAVRTVHPLGPRAAHQSPVDVRGVFRTRHRESRPRPFVSSLEAARMRANLHSDLRRSPVAAPQRRESRSDSGSSTATLEN